MQTNPKEKYSECKGKDLNYWARTDVSFRDSYRRGLDNILEFLFGCPF